MTVKLILKENIEKLGDAGEIVKVRDGYARNYLIPNNFAMIANAQNLLVLKDQKEKFKEEAEKKRKKAEEIKQKIESQGVLELKLKVGPTGKLFGRVTGKDLSEILSEKTGEIIDKKSVRIFSYSRGIDELGNYKIEIDLGSAVFAKLDLSVIEQ